MRHGHNCRSGKGPSSFLMQQPEKFFKELALDEGDTLLDLGCSVGDYSIGALDYLGETGFIYAVDKNSVSLSCLQEYVEANGIINIKTIVSDILKQFPLPDNSIDRCLIATVLHTFDLSIIGTALFSEIDRVMKDSAVISILECNPKNKGFGPPEKFRVSAETVENLIIPLGYKKIKYFDFGHNYLIQFGKGEKSK